MNKQLPLCRRIPINLAVFSVLLSALSGFGQSQLPDASAVPRLVKYAGVVKDAAGKPLTGTVGITFAMYATESGGSPLWIETQNVEADVQGRFSVYLGATKSDGLPQNLFVSGEARWLGVQPQGQGEQRRTQLISVPYAMKAGDAQTIGGLPPSAFVLAVPSTGSNSPRQSSSSSSVAPALGGGGTVNFIPLWTPDGSTLGNSVVFQSGTGSTAKIGVNTTGPGATLDVKGTGTIRGTLSLPATGAATATGGKNSQPLNWTASAFNSGTSAAVAQNFRWQAEPVGNNTTTPSGKFNLLFGSGTNPPTETGLSLASSGQITFANGQTFPGTGTITGVTAGAGLSGGGTSGNVTLSVPSAGITNGMLQNSVVTVSAGTDLTGGGVISLGGSTTLNVDTTKVPQLSAANNFTNNQSVTGNMTATGTVTGLTVNATSAFDLNGTLFASGNPAMANAFLGFGGNNATTGTGNTAVGKPALVTNTSGSGNTAIGSSALESNTSGSNNEASGGAALTFNTTGSNNTADGADAMFNNTTGSSNTAVGLSALANNQTGNSNTAIGVDAGTTSGFFTTGSFDTFVGASTTPGVNVGITNATAIGAQAEVDASNSMVLGSINGVNSATANTNIGIGITKPVYRFQIGNAGDVPVNGFLRVEGPVLSLSGIPAASFGGFGDFAVDAPGIVGGRFVVKESGFVGVGAFGNPSRIFTVGAGKGHAIADGWDVYSSRRWKTNIHTLGSALDKVEHLRGVSYDLKSNGKHEIGVIAEEVGQVVPEVVSYEANGKDAQGVDYSRLTALLIEAVKQQQQQIRLEAKRAQAQRSEIASLRLQLRKQAAKDALLESRLGQLERNQANATKLAQYQQPTR